MTNGLFKALSIVSFDSQPESYSYLHFKSVETEAEI